MKIINLKSLLIFGCLVFVTTSVSAQDGAIEGEGVVASDITTSAATFVEDSSLKGVTDRIAKVKPDVNLNQIPSLFFTPSEQSLIAEARLGFMTRPPTDFELRQAEQGQSVPMGPRELALGGIVYRSAGDWTIWVNGEKITPKRLLPEILDIKVRRGHVKLRWFDAYTNQIFPIKLKSHQRFNIDTRIFLPGEGTREEVSEY